MTFIRLKTTNLVSSVDTTYEVCILFMTPSKVQKYIFKSPSLFKQLTYETSFQKKEFLNLRRQKKH